MEKNGMIKGLLEKGTKMRKDKWLIVILSGILLAVISFPVQEKSKETDRRDAILTKKETEADEQQVQVKGIEEDVYGNYWEKRLEETLSTMEGAGKVKVLITVKESARKIVEKDGPETREETEEEDSSGGRRQSVHQQTDKNTIYTINDKGDSVPFITRTCAPIVEGVVVLSQGADNRVVKQNIIDAIQVLFNIDANKIRVVKMKNKNV